MRIFRKDSVPSDGATYAVVTQNFRVVVLEAHPRSGFSWIPVTTTDPRDMGTIENHLLQRECRELHDQLYDMQSLMQFVSNRESLAFQAIEFTTLDEMRRWIVTLDDKRNPLQDIPGADLIRVF